MYWSEPRADGRWMADGRQMDGGQTADGERPDNRRWTDCGSMRIPALHEDPPVHGQTLYFSKCLRLFRKASVLEVFEVGEIQDEVQSQLLLKEGQKRHRRDKCRSVSCERPSERRIDRPTWNRPDAQATERPFDHAIS